MKNGMKILGFFALTGLVAMGATWSRATEETSSEASAEVSADGDVVSAKNDGNGFIDGFVTFKINVPFEKLAKHFRDPGTLGKISPQVTEYEAKLDKEDDNVAVYKTTQKITPFQNIPFLSSRMEPSVVGVDYSINKKALAGGAILVNFQLNPSKPGKWEKLEGHIYAIDQGGGNTRVMMDSHTKSTYSVPSPIRTRLVKRYLSKTKDYVVAWAAGLQ